MKIIFMRRYIILLIVFFIATKVDAQTGKISGKIISTVSGQALPNATILLVEKNKVTIADQNGNFLISNITAGTYTIQCTSIGYDEKLITDVVVKVGETSTITISLDEKSATNKEVVITTKKVSAAKESVASLLIAQKNNASVSDGISTESIKKTPDRSTSDVLKRVSGASIQDDRFAIIRGLNDRYNAAFINGAPLPSTESDRKAFAFDIFPSSILDNLIIYKTATPDKTGEFAGGIIDVSTKSIPDKNFLSLSFSIGYNNLITGKKRYASETKGSTDWLGIDDGTRAMPSGLPSALAVKNQLTFAERAALAKMFGKYKWGVKKTNTLPDFNIQLAKGFNVERKGTEFIGALFSVNYKRGFTFNKGERNSYGFDLTAPIDAPLDQKGRYSDSSYNSEVVIAALGNVSVKLNNRNSLSWKNNFSVNTDNKLIRRTGFPDYTSDATFFTKETVRWFTSNQIFSSQLSGDHQAGKIKTKINWLASYSKIKRDIPSLARTAYSGFLPDADNVYPIFSSPPAQNTGTGTMFFSDLDESIKSIKSDVTQPYYFLKSHQNTAKAGAGYQYRKRKVSSRILGFAPYDNGVTFDYSLLQLPEDQIFLPGHLGLMENGMGGFKLNDGTLSNSDYTASSALVHAYIMNDQRLLKKIRLIYGVRMERFNQQLNTVRNLSDTINLNTTVTDFLPSANIVYALTAKMNVRVSYSKTVNRPEFRELAPYLFYDFVTQFTYEGYENLKRALINNFDFRYEFYPGRAQLFSASAFYKNFTDPVEFTRNKLNPDQALYVNASAAKIYGAEVEFRTLLSTIVGSKNEHSLLNKITLAANASYIKSEVKVPADGIPGAPAVVLKRALQGQSPYLVNGSINFTEDKLGISSTISINRVGDRIFIAGTTRDPDIYEKARTVLDFQFAQALLKNKLELKFTARDLLAQKTQFYFDADLSKSYSIRDKLFSSNTAPAVFVFAATYKF